MGGLFRASHFICIMEDYSHLVKNTYVIRQKLSNLQKRPGDNHFEYWVGNKFRVNIYPRDIQDLGHEDKKDRVTFHNHVDVNVYDITKDSDGVRQARYIYLDRDSRFTNYEPIKYKEYGSSDGRQMPLNNVCELIKYLHIISKLTAFL